MLKSGAAGHGFFDVLGAGLDGAGDGGHADFATTFTTHYQANVTAGTAHGTPDG